MTGHNKIGIDLGGTKIAAVALSGSDKVLFEARMATPKGDYHGVIKAIAALVEQAKATCGGPTIGSEPTIGIGIPGSQNPQTGLIQNANSTWMNGKDFQRDVSAALGQPVRLANDADCFTLSESHDGAGIDARTVFGVIIGTGCGGGLVIDGKLLAGRHAIAGEWGHTPLPWPNNSEFPAPVCWCGRQGCLELWVSGSGLERDFNTTNKAVSGQDLSADEISWRALEGDEACRNALDHHCDRLARGLAMVSNIIDPDVIVLGGGLSNMGHLYQRLPDLMEPYIFADPVNIDIRCPLHGDASGVRGAARLWDASP